MFYRRYVGDIFVLFRKKEHLKLFLNYFYSYHKNIKFTFEKETNSELSFLDIEISKDKKQFMTLVYRKPTFSGVFSQFDSFIPRSHNFNLVSTLIFRCYSICCSVELFHIEIMQLKEIFSSVKWTVLGHPGPKILTPEKPLKNLERKNNQILTPKKITYFY